MNKHLVVDSLNTFRSVLQTGKAVMTVNLGFRPKDNTVFTYTQEKIGWNYFYVKRKVLANEIHTVPLDITLSYTKRIRKLKKDEYERIVLVVVYLYLI